MPDEDDVSSSSEESDSSSEDEAPSGKQAEVDKKKAEVRKRLEEASKAKRAKKGFMTPERKKKLRLLLRKKAAEELKKEQERKAAERRRIIDERCGYPKDVEEAEEEELHYILQIYHERLLQCESTKWDLEFEVRKKDFEINELNIQVNDLRGKFIKPSLKKVSKYENKFAKLQKKAAEFNFRNNLKQIKKKEFTMDDEGDQGARGVDKFGEKKGKKKKPVAEGEEPEPLDDDEEEEEEGPTFKMRLIFHDKSKWSEDLLDHESEAFTEFVAHGEEVLSNILPQVDGLRGYSILDIEKVNDRICTHGEGPMFADADIDAAKEKCTHILQESLRSQSKTVSEEMCANFNENTYGLVIDFFDPPRCHRIQLHMDFEKVEFLSEHGDPESRDFQKLEQKLHDALLKPLKEVGGVATKAFKIIGLGEKGPVTRPGPEGEPDEEYMYIHMEADIATDRHIHTKDNIEESSEKIKEKINAAIEDPESAISKLVNKENINMFVTLIDPTYVDPKTIPKVLKETKVEVKLVLDQMEWRPEFENPESDHFKNFMAQIESMFSPAVPPILPTPPPTPPPEPEPEPEKVEEKPEEPKPEEGAEGAEPKPEGEEGKEGPPAEGEGEKKEGEGEEKPTDEGAPPEEPPPPKEPTPEPEKLMSHMSGFKGFHGMKLVMVDGKVCMVGDIMVDTIKECHLEGDNVKAKVADELLSAVSADNSILKKLVTNPNDLKLEASVVSVIDPDYVPTPPEPEPEPEPEEIDEPAEGAPPEEEVPAEPAAPAEAPKEGEAKPAEGEAKPAEEKPAETPAS